MGALLVTLAAPVSAAGTVNVYAVEGSDIFYYDGAPHYVVYYKIPHGAVQFPLHIAESFVGPTLRPIVKGVDYSVVNTLTDHKDPQKWDYYARYPINTNQDRLILVVPKTYVLKEYAKLNFGWAYDIYLTVYT